MKRLFLSILLCVFVWGMKAQEMDAVFVAMPDQYVPQLENAWRKDLIDLYNYRTISSLAKVSKIKE